MIMFLLIQEDLKLEVSNIWSFNSLRPSDAYMRQWTNRRQAII